MGIAKTLFRGIVEFFLLFIVVTFIPGIPPDVNISEPFKLKKVTLDGKLSLNNKLNNIEILYKDDVYGPESFADEGSSLYTSLHSGDIVKIIGKHIVPVVKFGKPCKGTYEEQKCGRPLGIRFGSDGYLYAADAYYGIFKVDVKTGDKKQLVSINQKIDDKRTKFPNSVAITCNGDVYWTESSTDFPLEDSFFTLLADPSGRLIHYDAKTGKNKVLLDKLHFANGVILSQNEDFVLVAETMKNRITRYYLKGEKKGSSDVFLDGLPGLPDNIQTDGGSGYLVGIIMEASVEHPNIIQVFSQFPRIRKFFARSFALAERALKAIDKFYPNEFCKKGIHVVGHLEPTSSLVPSKSAIVHISEHGKILDTIWSTNKTIGRFSEAHIVKDQLYLGSPFNNYMGRIPLSKIGWEHLKQKADSITAIKQRCSGKNRELPKAQNQIKSESSKTTGQVHDTEKPVIPKPVKSVPTETKYVPTTTTPAPTTTTHAPTTTTPAPTTTTPFPTTTTPVPTTTSQTPTRARAPSSTTSPPTATKTASKPAVADTKSTHKPDASVKTNSETIRQAQPKAPIVNPTPSVKKEQATSTEKPNVVKTPQKRPEKSEPSKTKMGSQEKTETPTKQGKVRSQKNEL